jgi:hypothetical protein
LFHTCITEEQEILLDGAGDKIVESVKTSKPVKKSLPQKRKVKGILQDFIIKKKLSRVAMPNNLICNYM